MLRFFVIICFAELAISRSTSPFDAGYFGYGDRTVSVKSVRAIYDAAALTRSSAPFNINAIISSSGKSIVTSVIQNDTEIDTEAPTLLNDTAMRSITTIMSNQAIISTGQDPRLNTGPVLFPMQAMSIINTTAANKTLNSYQTTDFLKSSFREQTLMAAPLTIRPSERVSLLSGYAGSQLIPTASSGGSMFLTPLPTAKSLSQTAAMSTSFAPFSTPSPTSYLVESIRPALIDSNIFYLSSPAPTQGTYLLDNIQLATSSPEIDLNLLTKFGPLWSIANPFIQPAQNVNKYPRRKRRQALVEISTQ